jgi:hypothetical protein
MFSGRRLARYQSRGPHSGGNASDEILIKDLSTRGQRDSFNPPIGPTSRTLRSNRQRRTSGLALAPRLRLCVPAGVRAGQGPMVGTQPRIAFGALRSTEAAAALAQHAALVVALSGHGLSVRRQPLNVNHNRPAKGL